MSRPFWTREELDLLRQIYAEHDDASLCVAMADAGFDRTLESVRAKRIRLGLHRGECKRPQPPVTEMRPKRGPHELRDQAFVRALAVGLQEAGLAPRLGMAAE